MTIHTYNMLMKELSDRLCFPDMVPDNNGYLGLAFDQVEVHFQYDDEKEEILLFNYLPEIEKTRRTEIYGLLLSANQFWIESRGATFSLSKEDNHIMLADRQNISLLSAESLEQWLERFVNTAEYWQTYIERINAGEPIKKDNQQSSMRTVEQGRYVMHV